MADVTVNSNICGFVHKIHGEKIGKNIVIDIETDCEKIKKMSRRYPWTRRLISRTITL